MPLTPALVELLTRATTDPKVPLSEADALALARQYGGKGVRIKPSALSLRLADAVTGDILPADVKTAQARLARQLQTSTAGLTGRLSRASSAERQRHSDALQDAYEADARLLAAKLVKDGNVAAWQRSMGARVIQHLVEQRTMGAGRALRDSELRQMGPVVREQLAYLSRFADEVAVRNLRGRPLSEAAIAARASQYGGIGRAAYFAGAETAEAGRPGMIVVYEARDDDRTCGPCLDAEARGPYLPGDPSSPYPGQVCLGRARCRCRRVLVYDPDTYARLTGQVAA